MTTSASTFTYLDAYCERAGDAGLLGEPLNLFTNAAFLIAALLLWRVFRRSSGALVFAHADFIVLIVLLALVGLGSFFWHLQPNGVTLLLDVIPIALFINLFLLGVLIRLLHLNWWQAVMVMAFYQGLGLLSEYFLPREMLNGSVMYLPTYVMLFVMCVWLAIRKHAFLPTLVQGTLLFTLSLFFRTFDTGWCAAVPFGTHFLWHVLNAILLYILVKGLLRTALKPDA